MKDVALADAPARPARLPVIAENIPTELRARPQWVVWRWTWSTVKSKWDKPPLNARTGRNASSTAPNTWSTFDVAYRAYSDGAKDYDGIGYVFSADDPYVGIDLDDCRDPTSGTLAPWQHRHKAWSPDAPAPQTIIDALGTYGEVSPSQCGAKLLCRGTIPRGGKRGDFEAYSHGRYFTITGRRLDCCPATIAELNGELENIVGKFLRDASPDTATTSTATTSGLDPQTIIAKAARAKNGAKFLALWNGDAGHDHSAADLALCSLLAFWTGPNPALIDQLFRQSRLMRGKWDEPHFAGGKLYGQGTIERALAKCGTFYDWTPRNERKETNDDSCNERPLTTPRLVNLGTIVPRAVRWLWPRRIALGKLTTIAGEPGLGKSQLLLDIIARVTTGNPWPDNIEGFNAAGSAVLLSAEDDIEDTIVPRLIAAGADLNYVTALQGVEFKLDDKTPAKQRCFNLECDLPALEQAINALPDCRIVGIDPISSYLGGTDSHKNAELRGLLAPLSDLAAKRNVAVVSVTHLNKTSGAKAMHRVTGSLAFVAAARAAWLVTQDKENATRRLFLPIKNNLAKDNGGLAFGIIDMGGSPALAWEEGIVNVTADEALREDDRKEKTREREKAWLTKQLADGPRTQEALRAEVRETGFSWRTIRRASEDLGVEKFKSGFRGGWSWRLPDTDPPPSSEN